MQSAQKFAFTFPFIADELRIYPVTFLGAKSFRVELYGCYLGKYIAFEIGFILPHTIQHDSTP